MCVGVDKGVAFDGICGKRESEIETKKAGSEEGEKEEPSSSSAMDRALDTSTEDASGAETGESADDEERWKEENIVFPAISLSRKGTRASVGKFKWRRH